jgi:hypothetical protein
VKLLLLPLPLSTAAAAAATSAPPSAASDHCAAPCVYQLRSATAPRLTSQQALQTLLLDLLPLIVQPCQHQQQHQAVLGCRLRCMLWRCCLPGIHLCAASPHLLRAHPTALRLRLVSSTLQPAHQAAEMHVHCPVKVGFIFLVMAMSEHHAMSDSQQLLHHHPAL